MTTHNTLSPAAQKEISQPIFILGCGRSGTTIFGTALSKHRSITYLNEPRDLWFDTYPETDIWTDQASARNGRMYLSSEHSDDQKSVKIRQLFHQQTVSHSKPVLIEKLPINNFRVKFIDSIFPDARFIHIYRNGLEVASSIEKICEKGGWFGSSEYKWKQLIDYAQTRASTANLSDFCDSCYTKALLEWRLSTESVVQFFQSLAAEKYMEISYATLVNEPVETMMRVLAYIGVDPDPAVIEFGFNNISRRSKSLDCERLSSTEAKLGGVLLPLSMDSSAGGLTKQTEELGA